MRYYTFIFTIFLTLGAIFFSTYSFVEKKLNLDIKETENIREARNIKIVFFKKATPLWVIYGSKADFSDIKTIKIYNFRAKNLKSFLKLGAQIANFINLSTIKLYKNVILKFLERGNLVVVETDSATVDLRRKIIFGNGKVVVKKPGETLIGEGFKYYLKTGKFIILKNVQTYLIAS